MADFTDTVSMTAPTDAPPEELLMARLAGELLERAPLVELYGDYYEGRHSLQFVSSPYRRAFGQMLAGVSDNWCSLVVNAGTERIEVQGFHVGDGTDDELNSVALALWRRCGMNVDAGLAFVEASKSGEAYLLVGQDPGTGLARMSVEHPRQFIVERAPEDRRRLTAALKLWWDDELELLCLTLWTPNGIYRRARGLRQPWFQERPGAELEEVNPFGAVPVAPLVNDPQMLPALPPTTLLGSPHNAPAVAVGLGRSDLADVVASQNAINQLVSSMLVAAEFSAFRQRWATGLEVPKDPETGEPIQPFRAAVDRVWSSGSPDTRFGEFLPADLGVYIQPIEWLIRSLASRTRIPPHILMSGSGNWPSGETLKAAESGLMSKVHAKMRAFGPAIAYAMSLALGAELGETGAGPSIVIDWLDPERRVESEFVDSLVKKLAMGVPPQQLWQDYGYSDEQIAGFAALLEEARAQGIIAPPAAAPAPTGGELSV